MNTKELKHINGEQTFFLAEVFKCSTDYVRKVVKGKRKSKSSLSKKLYTAAETLNTAIEFAQKEIIKELEITSEKD